VGGTKTLKAEGNFLLVGYTNFFLLTLDPELPTLNLNLQWLFFNFQSFQRPYSPTGVFSYGPSSASRHGSHQHLQSQDPASVDLKSNTSHYPNQNFTGPHQVNSWKTELLNFGENLKCIFLGLCSIWRLQWFRELTSQQLYIQQS